MQILMFIVMLVVGLLGAATAQRGLQLFVRGHVDGIDTSLCVEVEMNATVAQLQQAICQATGSEFEMVFADEVLADPEATLADSGVTSEAQIWLRDEPYCVQMQRFLASMGPGNSKYEKLVEMNDVTRHATPTGVPRFRVYTVI